MEIISSMAQLKTARAGRRGERPGDRWRQRQLVAKAHASDCSGMGVEAPSSPLFSLTYRDRVRGDLLGGDLLVDLADLERAEGLEEAGAVVRARGVRELRFGVCHVREF